MVKIMVKMILFVVLLLVYCGNSYNIEERIPMVKRGHVGSLFGLSVAQHYITASADSTDDVVLLVGAPLADASDFHSKDSVKPGALFSCSVSSNENDCQSVRIDDSRNSFVRNNSNQWLGVTVKSHSPGGRVAVCAHRFAIHGGTARQGIIWEAELGRCYMLTAHLEPETVSPEKIPCMGKTNDYSQANFGYCQAGISAAFVQNTDEDFVIGMPGIFHWTGGIKSSELSDKLFFPQPLWSKKDLSSDFDNIPQNSYNGFSVVAGRLTKSNFNFVSGAPRVNDTGAVVIYEKYDLQAGKGLRTNEVIYGEAFASAFGYDVNVIDVTGDGRDDLIVGAPQYFDRKSRIGGAVYIYVNNGLEKIGPNPTTVLYGEVDSAFGSSITSLGDINMDGVNDVAIGAPGADDGAGVVYIYHGNRNSSIGVSDTAMQVIRGKTLSDTHKLNVSGFGYSMSGGLDMDFNGYPDLLVGSLSDFAVLYRTRPIINVQASITASLSKVSIVPKKNPNTIKFKDPLTKQQYKLVTFNVTICMQYTSLPSSYNEAVDMTYTIKLDTVRLDNSLRPRATFVPLDYKHGIKTEIMKLFPQSMSRRRCVALPIYLDNNMQDKLSPFMINVTFDVLYKNISNEFSSGEVLSLNPYPLLNKNSIKHTSTQVNISKNCGRDEICKSDLQMDAKYMVLFAATNTWEVMRLGSDGIPELIVGTEKAIGVKIYVSNPHPGEDAHQANLRIELPEFLYYIGLADVASEAATVSCTVVPENSSIVTCNLGNPFRTDSSLSMIIKLGNDPRLYEIRQFALNMELSTSSTQKQLGLVQFPVSVRTQVEVIISGFSSNDQVSFSGKPIGESAVKKPSDAGLPIHQGYEVENTGNTALDGVYVNISWPQRISNGKWLFYLLSAEMSGPGVNETRCDLPAEFNPLNLKKDVAVGGLYSDTGNARLKRDTNSDVNAEAQDRQPAAVVEGHSSHKQLKCPGSAQCINFKCRLGTLLPQIKVFIRLDAVSWNSTLVEEYYGVAEVRVYSSATVGLTIKNAKNSPTSVFEAEISTSMLSEKVIAPEEQVKLWIIIVATLVGVILLVVIVILLWKCGFFKRRRDYGDYHKARKHQQASQKVDENSDRLLSN